MKNKGKKGVGSDYTVQFFIQVHTCCSAHTPYLPEVLQRGRVITWEEMRGREGGRQEGRREGEFIGGKKRGSVDGTVGEETGRKKVGILGDRELRMIFIHNEEKREKMEGLLVMRMKDDG